MKQQSPSAQVVEQFEFLNRRVGTILLSAIVVFVAVWLYLQSRRQATAPPQELPRAEGSIDAVRFRTDLGYLPNEPLLGFVEVPAGTFTMGSDPDAGAPAYQNERWSTDRNQGTPQVSEFYINRYEVTIAQFRAFVSATHYQIGRRSLQGALNLPVANVSWTDALAYSRWLETLLKNSPQTPALLAKLLNTGWRIGLPSEAEWEKAARGTDGRIYPWGNTADHRYANFGSTGALPVGSFACGECAFSLEDMSGNVWEMTRSPFRDYPFDPAAEHAAAQGVALFVMRGGSFNDDGGNVRTAIRGGIDPGSRSSAIGFRIALSRY